MPPVSEAGRRGGRPAANRRLHFVRGLVPYRQGDLDGFCGLYSAINAVRLSLHDVTPLSPSQCEALFHHGVRYLQRHGKLSACARYGLSRQLWRRLVNQIVQRTIKITGVPLEVQRPFAGAPEVALPAVIATIEEMLRAGNPILALLEGVYAHYTVLVGYSTTRVSLFDSYGYRWVRRTSVDVVHDAAVARHLIHPASLTVILR